MQPFQLVILEQYMQYFSNIQAFNINSNEILLNELLYNLTEQ